MTEVILIRHGETDWNRERRFQGHIDIPLNCTGREQARRLGQRLAGERIDAFYSSDLVRAFETALASAGLRSLPVTALSGLRERSYGIFEGLTVPEIRERHPHAMALWSQHDPDFAIPSGESVRQCAARIVPLIKELAGSHGGQRIMIVTHGGVLDMVYRAALGLALGPARTCPIPNAALNRLHVTQGHIAIIAWADTAHLQESEPTA